MNPVKLIKHSLIAAALSLAPAALAQTSGPYLGLYSGYPGGLGVQYTTGSLRFSAGLPFWYGLGLEAAADYLVRVPGQAPNITFAYGGGVGVGLYGGGVVSLFPHGLGNAEFALSPGLGLFLEAQLGPALVLAGGNSYLGLDWGSRIGLNFR